MTNPASQVEGGAGFAEEDDDQVRLSTEPTAPAYPVCLCRRAGGQCLAGSVYCELLDQLGQSDPAGAVQRARAEHRRYAALAACALDRMLRGEGVEALPTPACRGDHHPGMPCDPWGPCSGAAYTYREHRQLRAEVAA